MRIKVIFLVFLLLSCSIIISACSVGGPDKKKITAYLDAVSPDFEKSKEDLAVFDEKFSEDLAGVTKVLNQIKNSKADFQSGLDKAKKQQVPSEPKELAAFNNSLVQYYTDSIKFLGEYETLLEYAQGLLGSITPLEKVTTSDLGRAPSIEEIKSVAKTMKSAIVESTMAAEKCKPPEYMADSHEKYMGVLKKYGSCTDDMIYALQIQDPLRLNSTNYRYGLLSNKLTKIGNEMNNDIENQQVVMNELGSKLKKSQDDLYKQLLLWQGQYKSGS